MKKYDKNSVKESFPIFREYRNENSKIKMILEETKAAQKSGEQC